jgi:hypothetical protein
VSAISLVPRSAECVHRRGIKLSLGAERAARYLTWVKAGHAPPLNSTRALERWGGRLRCPGGAAKERLNAPVFWGGDSAFERRAVQFNSFAAGTPVSNPFPCRSSESLSLERAQGGSDCRAGQSGQYLGYQEHATRHTGRRPCNRTANSDPQGQRQERDRGGLADLPVLQSSSSSTCRPPARSGSKFRRRCSRADEVIE